MDHPETVTRKRMTTENQIVFSVAFGKQSLVHLATIVLDTLLVNAFPYPIRHWQSSTESSSVKEDSTMAHALVD